METVPDDKLPVTLPDDVEFLPTGAESTEAITKVS